MAIEKLLEVNPPSGRVLGQGLLEAPILKQQWRWNREEIAKKGSDLEGFGKMCKYRLNGSLGVSLGVQAATWRGPPWSPGGPLWLPFGALEGSFALIFYWIFLEFLEHFK